jgi:hypothetical protein
MIMVFRRRNFLGLLLMYNYYSSLKYRSLTKFTTEYEDRYSKEHSIDTSIASKTTTFI